MYNTPTFLISQKKVERNINKMIDKAEISGVEFRPHFKTHQSAEVGNMFRKKGVEKITVSSVSMAQFFASHGWNDITIAFPVNLMEIDQIKQLATEIQLNLLVDSAYSIRILSDTLRDNVGVFIEIDNGYHRSGLLPDQLTEIEHIIHIAEQSDKLIFKGFLTHAGNTYSAKGENEILSIMKDAATKLDTLKDRFTDKSPAIITSYGDTPSCSMADDLSDFDEIRPGNFVYYDVMQYHIGSCSLDDIAVAVACPIVSVYPERNELVIYGGAVHLSKEDIEGDNGFKLFGYIVNLTRNGWSEPIPGAYVSSISQEHGIVIMPNEFISNFKPGDVVGVLPVHSCLTPHLLRNSVDYIDTY